MIIDDYGEVICRHTVGFENHKIIQHLIVENDLAPDQVVDNGGVFIAGAKPDYRSRPLSASACLSAGVRRTATVIFGILARAKDSSAVVLVFRGTVA